ncbi:MAG: hypothetical protein NTZ98_24705 [Acidobacteria bacterium]|nr:hypothetical protein [Acidobacteriota bacterium]
MFAKKSWIVGLAIAVLVAGIAVAAQTEGGKRVAKRVSKMLNPDWTTEKGTYDQPAATLGEKPAQPWTETTVNAGVNKQPLKGEIVTVTGEVIDLSCYLQLGKHGAKHKDCGIKCLRAGQPIGLLSEDGSVYVLMEEEHDPRRDGKTSLRDAAIEHFAQIVQVTGTSTTVDGQKALYVQGFVKQ